MNKKKNYQSSLLTDKLIFVGGVTRCGKSLLLPIISTFNKTEMFFCNSIAENVYFLNYLKLLDDETASYLFRHVYNEKIYNLNIGRELNKRKNDYSSIYNYKNPKIYIQREKSINEGDLIIENIKKQKNNYPIMFHNVLLNPNFIFKAYPKSKVIFIERHPVDLIFSWIKKKYSGKFYSNPRATTLSFKSKKITYPFWCERYQEEYGKLDNIYEKTIFLIDKLYVVQKKNFLKFKKKFSKNILLVKFEKLTEETDDEIIRIEKFLNLKKSKFTVLEIKKQRGNRNSTNILRETRRNEVINNISEKFKKKLIELEKIYIKK